MKKKVEMNCRGEISPEFVIYLRRVLHASLEIMRSFSLPIINVKLQLLFFSLTFAERAWRRG